MMGDMNWSGGMMVAMSVISLIVVLGVIGGIVLLVRSLSGPRSAPSTDSRTALTILDERFARGDIDREEFENKRSLLSRSSPR